jgi:transcription initiation factor TFIID TATA-box-binding protein
MDIVKIVANGKLNFDELDIEQLYRDMGESLSRLKPGRLDIEFDDDTPLIMVYPAGTYTIPGATSLEELHETRERFLNYLQTVSDGRLSEESFSVKYMVFMSEFETSINLEALSIKLGLENVEYEPEQFPGLIYRVEQPQGVVLIFSSGKVLFTGFENDKEAKLAEKQLQNEIG